MGTDETVFNAIMVSRSYAHLREVFKAYARNTGNDIEEVIEKEFSGNTKEVHLTIGKLSINILTSELVNYS